MTAQEVIDLLQLEPLEMEGGFFRQNYKNSAEAENGAPLSTAIYYLLTPDTFSCLHHLPADEVYHFYLGDPVELLLLDEKGPCRCVTLGSHIGNGMAVQTVVPAGVWQGSYLLPGGSWALLGTTMTPGFTDEGFTAPCAKKIDELCRRFPQYTARIDRLTKR